MRANAVCRAGVVSGICLSLLSACGSGSGTEPEPLGPAANVVANSVTTRSGTAGALLPDSLVVRVLDAKGRGIPGHTVVWTTESFGPGNLSPAQSLTDENGRARSAWTLPTHAGETVARAGTITTNGPVNVEFRADVEPGPTTVLRIEPSAAYLDVGETRQLALTRADTYGNVIANRSVAWTSSAPGIVSVNAGSGAIRALSAGSAMIRAETDGRTASAQIMVLGSASAAGEDRFDANTLPEYVQHADSAASWTVAQGTLTASGYGIHSVLIRSGVAIRDGWVETTSDHIDDGGLVLRFQDNRNYYLLALRDDSSPSPRPNENLKLYKRVDGFFDQLWSKDLDWPRGTSRTVRFEAVGTQLNISVDGVPVASVEDPSAIVRGGVGLRHYGDSAAWTSTYDLLRWRPF